MSALGTLVIKKIIELGNAKLVRATLVGDAAYTTGGTAGLLPALRAALKDDGLQILSVTDLGSGDSAGGATIGVRPEYIQPVFTTNDVYGDKDPRSAIASGDKLFIRVLSTGAESADADQSDATYNLQIIAY